jgi:uroporphyrinogen decarboxylase
MERKKHDSHLDVSPADHLFRAVGFDYPRSVPVACCISSPYICGLYGANVKDYIFDAQLKLKIQCAFQEEFPEMMIVPGIYPDFGCGVVEPSAFGCRLVQRENNPLSPEPRCPKFLHAKSGEMTKHEITALTMPDLNKDGLLPQVLSQYRYFWKNIENRFIDRYGYLDGFGYSMGPVETAALVVGYENFLIGLHDFPKVIHGLLDMVTDFIIAWVRLQEQVNGKLKRIYFFDHTPARVGPDHFEEFIFPYLSRLMREFSYAVKIFHICDKKISHVLERLGDLGIDVLYFAADISEVKDALGEKVCLMGNLDPIGLILKGGPERISAECGRCIDIAGDSRGGYILAPSGAFIPGTPKEHVHAIVRDSSP